MTNSPSPKYHLIIYGCQMNKSDAERIAAVLESLGFTETDRENIADLIVIVACSVRQRAIDRVYAKIRKIKTETRQCLVSTNKQPFTVLTGCVLESDRKKLAKLFDVIIKIEEIGKLPKLMASWLHGFMYNNSTDKKIRQQWNNETMKQFNPPPAESAGRASNLTIQQFNNISPKYSSKISAYVPIMNGCNNFCTYCVVPYTRGREIPRPADDIIYEIKSLVAHRYKEIALLGQNVNAYFYQVKSQKSKMQIKNQKYHLNTKIRERESMKSRKQFNNLAIEQFAKEINFAKLLKLVNHIPGTFWIRFITSNPWDLSDEIITAMAECEKVCKYLHLPVQSGSNEILKKMNRQYSKEQYFKLIQKIRKKMPEIALSTDIIVGFPGETKKQFMQTADLMKKIKFDMAYIAQYSPRPGTFANKHYTDNISSIEKTKRKKILETILQNNALKNNQRYIGKTLKILVLSHETTKNKTQKDTKIYIGKSKCFKNVKFEAKENNIIGNFIMVKITQATFYGLFGKI